MGWPRQMAILIFKMWCTTTTATTTTTRGGGGGGGGGGSADDVVSATASCSCMASADVPADTIDTDADTWVLLL